ncbi:MAG: hypothetical protein K2Q26_06895 [Bdellovibrionales bacterium]|nr:hypothetical protein [Bdellovibrionales bacterium]
MKTISSYWNSTLNFNLLLGGIFLTTLSSYFLIQQGRAGAAMITLGLAFVFTATFVFLLIRRNLRLSYNDDHLVLHRFPYLKSQRWHWSDIHAIDVHDERYDEKNEKTGEALYLRDSLGRKVLVAHRPGEQTELRQLAREIRQKIA